MNEHLSQNKILIISLCSVSQNNNQIFPVKNLNFSIIYLDKVNTVYSVGSKTTVYQLAPFPSQEGERDHQCVCNIMFDSGGEEVSGPRWREIHMKYPTLVRKSRGNPSSSTMLEFLNQLLSASFDLDQ